MLHHEDLAEKLIARAIEVHKHLGPACWNLLMKNATVMNSNCWGCH